MKKIARIICWIFVLLNLSQCSKDPDEVIDYSNTLPPATTSGENTVGFLLNGKVFTPLGIPEAGRKNLLFLVYDDGGFRLRVVRVEDGYETEFRLVSENITGTGTYPITPENSSDRIYFSRAYIDSTGKRVNMCFSENYFLSRYNATGFIKITRFDHDNRVVSGEFEATFTNSECEMGDRIDIKQGRFDMQYY